MTRKLLAIVAAAALLGGALGCERDQGAMEKAGEKVDEAVDKLQHPNEGPLEKAGRKVDEAVDDVKEKVE